MYKYIYIFVLYLSIFICIYLDRRAHAYVCMYICTKRTADRPHTKNKNTRKQDMPNFADGLHINVTVCGQTYYSDQARTYQNCMLLS